MLEILLSNDWVAGRDEILRLVSEDVIACRGGAILLVPELVSHDMERRLCEWAGDSACRYAEVLSFPRMVKRVQEYTRCGTPECLDEGGRIVAMAHAARQLHSRLKAYASVETKPEFLKQLVEAVDEFKRCCVTAKDLQWASAQCEGVFAQKLEELALLMEAYDSLCQHGKRDPRDQMNWLLEQLEDCDFAANHTLYVDGFPDFTRQHMAILEHFIGSCPKVVISLNCDKIGTTALSMEKAGQTASQIVKAAKMAGVDCADRFVPSKRTKLAPVWKGLFQGSIVAGEECRDRISLYYTNSVHKACEAAVEQVLRLVRKGCRYRDISIVCTDMAAYGDTLSRMMRRCSIPAYQSGTDEVLSNCVMTTILSAMRCALGGYDRKDLMQYVKSVLSPLNMDTCDLVENYTYIWSISGTQWKSEWTNHPRGLGEQLTEGDIKLLKRLNDARVQVITPLQNLTRGFQNAKNVQEQVKALYSFLEDINFARRMEMLAKDMHRAGDGRSAQILNQLWDILISSLEQLYDVLGETIWDSDTFIRLFMLLLQQYDVGTIPPVLDSVTVGPVSAMRCHQVDHLIILGAEEGKFPGYTGAKGVLTDQERVELRAMQLPLTGGALEGLQAEFSDIYGVVCCANETIAVFAPEANPSYVFKRLAKSVKEAVEYKTDPFKQISGVLDAAVYLAKENNSGAAEMLNISDEYQRICALRDHSLGELSPENVRLLYGEQLMLSASQIDVQAKCRMEYFLYYGIKARERKEITVDPAEFGTFVHDVLEHTCNDVLHRGGFHNVSAEETVQLARGYAAEYAQRFQELHSQRLEYLFQRNLMELDAIVKELWNELSVSEFAPVAFELNFGQKNAEMPAVDIPGADIPACVRGAVDRVDVWNHNGNHYYRVVDYKTGIKDFDYCDVFNGIGLQMLLYMFALENGEGVLGEHPRPVGVQYFPARIPYLSAEHKLEGSALENHWQSALKRKGLVLKDAEILEAMEPGGPVRLNVQIKKGEICGHVMDREQMRQLKTHIFDTLRELVGQVASGNVEPNPYTRGNDYSACRFCPYKTICHYVTVPGRRNYAAMNAERFWEEIGKESRNG